MNLGKCTPCLDDAILSRPPVDVDGLPEAIALAPFMMVTPQGTLAVPLPVCLKHRQAQLAQNGQRKLIVS